MSLRRRCYNHTVLSRNLSAGLMGHAINDVIEPHAKGHRSEGLRIVRIVSPLPCVAQVHIVADGHNNSPFVVADGAPFRLISILLVGASGPDILLTWNLHLVVDVIKGMKDFVATLQILDGAVGQHL